MIWEYLSHLLRITCPAIYFLAESQMAFICTADVITLDGHVVNEIVTYKIALATHANSVPLYVLGKP